MFFVVRSNGSFNFPLGLIKYIVVVIFAGSQLAKLKSLKRKNIIPPTGRKYVKVMFFEQTLKLSSNLHNCFAYCHFNNTFESNLSFSERTNSPPPPPPPPPLYRSNFCGPTISQDMLQSGFVECLNFRLIHGVCIAYTGCLVYMWMWHRTKGCLSFVQPLWCRDAVCCQIISTLTVARPGWWTSNEVSGSSLSTPVSGCITCCLPFVCDQD